MDDRTLWEGGLRRIGLLRFGGKQVDWGISLLLELRNIVSP
jgi:hypothetical protein